MFLCLSNTRQLPLAGFLSTGDDVLPGNLGLKDQILALKWVRKNINEFGGNRDAITIFGQCAGAVSAHLHILSPMAAGEKEFEFIEFVQVCLLIY